MKALDDKKIPLIFLHKGSPLYLQIALRKAKSVCSSDVYLIGDETNNYSYIKHAFIKDYNHNDLEKYYKHMSPNGYNYEIFCLQRWFVLKDFCKQNDINEFWALDSDILLYDDLANLNDIVEDIDFSLLYLRPNFTGPQLSYFKYETIADYCDFILDMYKNKIDVLENYYKQLQDEKNISGISDMVLLAFFAYEGKHKYIDFLYNKDSSFNFSFDENISLSEGFETKNKLKKVEFIKGIPYTKCLENNKMIKFYALHFQGNESKKKMVKYSRFSIFYLLSLDEYRTDIRNKLKNKISHVMPKKLKKIIKKILKK